MLEGHKQKYEFNPRENIVIKKSNVKHFKIKNLKR